VAHLGREGRRTDHLTDFLERFATAYERELEAFAQTVAHGDAPAVDGRDAIAAARLCDAAVEALRRRAPVGVAGLGEGGGLGRRADESSRMSAHDVWGLPRKSRLPSRTLGA
jgi:hypothetical protein